MGLPVDLKRGIRSGVLYAGVLIEVDFDECTRSKVRLRFTACNDAANPTELAAPFREDIREGVHFLTRRPKSVKLSI